MLTLDRAGTFQKKHPHQPSPLSFAAERPYLAMTSIPSRAISSEAVDPTLSNTAPSSTTSTTDRDEVNVDSDFYPLATQSKLDTPLTCDKITDGCVPVGELNGMSDGPAMRMH